MTHDEIGRVISVVKMCDSGPLRADPDLLTDLTEELFDRDERPAEDVDNADNP